MIYLINWWNTQLLDELYTSLQQKESFANVDIQALRRDALYLSSI